MSNQPSESEINMPEPDISVSQIMRKGFGGEDYSMPDVDENVSQFLRFTGTRPSIGEND